MMLELMHGIIWLVTSYLCFCRARKLNPETRITIVFGVAGLGTMAVANFIAPYIGEWGTPVTLKNTLTGLSIFWYLGGFENAWKKGAPAGTEVEDG